MKKTFIINLACAWLFFLFPAYTWAQVASQESESKGKAEYDSIIKDDDELQPEIPIRYTTLVADWGIANFAEVPNHMDLTFWGSRTLHGSLYYNIPIGKSHFMVSCGLGMADTDYTFKSAYTMVRGAGSDRKTKIEPVTNSIKVKSPTDIKSSIFSIKAAKFALEFRFNSNKEEPQEGFFIAVGGNIGFQFSPSTKIRYEEDKENKVRITQESYNFYKIHYGTVLRTGWNRFGLFYYQTLSTLFNADKGPEVKRIYPFSVGISFNFF